MKRREEGLAAGLTLWKLHNKHNRNGIIVGNEDDLDFISPSQPVQEEGKGGAALMITMIFDEIGLWLGYREVVSTEIGEDVD
jgi:hypothetical protein